MKYLPGDLDGLARYYNWTHGEKIALISATYLDIATYGFLVLLAMRNSWVILYK